LLLVDVSAYKRLVVMKGPASSFSVAVLLVVNSDAAGIKTQVFQREKNYSCYSKVWFWHESTTAVTEINLSITALFCILTNSIMYYNEQVVSLWQIKLVFRRRI
jgi:hypothetical protein